MPDHPSVTTGPKLGKLVYGDIGAGHINAMRALLRAFDQLVLMTVLDKDLATPPGSPANGDAYIVAASPTGAWAGQAGKIAVWSTEIATADTNSKVPAWEFYTPREGWLAYVADEDAPYRFDGAAWTPSVKFIELRLATFLEGVEIADPAAPAANEGRLYFRDNGAGKTQLVARFNSGAVQVIATEP